MITPEQKRNAAEMGKRLRECRLAAGLSQKELEQRAGTAARYVCKVESGKQVLSERLALRCGAVLCVDPDFLLCRSDHRSMAEIIESAGLSRKAYRCLLGLLEANGCAFRGAEPGAEQNAADPSVYCSFGGSAYRTDRAAHVRLLKRMQSLVMWCFAEAMAEAERVAPED